MKDICDRVVKELEAIGVSEFFGSKMSDDLQVTNEAKEKAVNNHKSSRKRTLIIAVTVGAAIILAACAYLAICARHTRKRRVKDSGIIEMMKKNSEEVFCTMKLEL
ncbi:uncharacterized protein DS421_1g32290 [Arachis hypogaea]|nr:uncharacterized protein DS421_1g32290 [Arachis hypogaea]